MKGFQGSNRSILVYINLEPCHEEGSMHRDTFADPFVPNALFLYSLKPSENHKVF